MSSRPLGRLAVSTRKMGLHCEVGPRHVGLVVVGAHVGQHAREQHAHRQAGDQHAAHRRQARPQPHRRHHHAHGGEDGAGQRDGAGRADGRDERDDDHAGQAGADEVGEVELADALGLAPEVEIITPTQTNGANSARQITTSMARFHSESPVP